MMQTRTISFLRHYCLTFPGILPSHSPPYSFPSAVTLPRGTIAAYCNNNNKWSMRTMSANTDNNVKHHVQYDLSRGHPNDGLLPLSEMQAIMFSFLHDVTPNTLKIDDTPNKKNINNNHEATNSWIRSLNYGPNAGDERFLLALQSFLNRRSANDDVLGFITGQEDDYDLHRTTKSMIDGDKNKNHHLFITGGVSHGLELLCSTLTSPGEEVWVERPTYFLAPKIFESHGLVVKSLPMMSDRNVDGIIPGNEENMADSGVGSNPKGQFQLSGVGQIDIDRLIQMVEHDGIHAPKMIYIIPSYQNPTGRIMSVQERKKLASFAMRNNVLVVADEVYHLLDWDTNNTEDQHHQSESKQDENNHSPQRPARMVCFNHIAKSDKFAETKTNDDGINNNNVNNKNKHPQGCCISVSSFTKIFAPGMRIGWIEAPPHIIEPLINYGYIDSQGGVAPFTGRMMTHAIESGLLDKYLDKLKMEYQGRYRTISNILDEEPRLVVLSDRNDSVKSRAGGYFVWVQFPLDVDSVEFLSFCLEEFGVKFMPGTRCDPFPLIESNGGTGDERVDPTGAFIRSCARLCFADLDRDALVNATNKFVQAFRLFTQR